MIYVSNGIELYETYILRHLLFDPESIETDLAGTFRNKPRMAWWGSPVNAGFGWKDFCKAENFMLNEYDFDRSSPILWTLKKGSKILKIDRIDEDVISYMVPDPEIGLYKVLDFKKLLANGFTAVELTDGSIGHGFSNKYEAAFNLWDCESIVVLDPSKIDFMRKDFVTHFKSTFKNNFRIEMPDAV